MQARGLKALKVRCLQTCSVVLAKDEAKDSLRLVVMRHDYKVDKNEDAMALEIIKM